MLVFGPAAERPVSAVPPAPSGGETIPPAPSPARRFAPALVLMAALAVRLAYLFGIEAYPKFELIRNRVDDQFFYDAWAKAILSGRELDLAGSGHEFAYWAAHVPGVFPQDPLYPYLLSAIYRVFGFDYDVVRMVQMAMGSLTAVLVYVIARFFVGRGAALLAGLAVALYGPLVFYEASFLREPLATTLATVGLFLLLSLVRSGRRTVVLAFAAGLAFGACVLLRSNMAVFAAAAAAWLASRARLRPALAYLAGLALVVLPVIAVNSVRNGGPSWVSSAGPFSFFVGNVHDASGAGPDAGELYRQVKAGGPPDPSRLLPAAITDIRAHPRDWLSLLGCKARFFFLSAREIPNNLSYDMGRKCNPRLALAPVGFHWIAPLALLGALVGWRARRDLGLLYLYVALYAGTVIAFFVVSRLRFPVVPALTVFAAVGVDWLFRSLRARRFLPALIALAAVVGGSLWLRPREPYYRETDFEMAAASYSTRAVLSERAGRLSEARGFYARAVALNPDHQFALAGAVRVGAELARQGEPPPRRADELCEQARQAAEARRYDEAVALLEQARRRAPESALPEHYLANVYYLRGEPGRALIHMERAVERAPENPTFRRNLLALRREALFGQLR